MHCCPHCSFRSKENVKCEKCESHVKEAQFDSKMSHQIKRERESFEYIQSYDDYGKYDDYGDYGKKILKLFKYDLNSIYFDLIK